MESRSEKAVVVENPGLQILAAALYRKDGKSMVVVRSGHAAYI